MTTEEEIIRLRRRAAELVEEASRRGATLSPEQDAEILSLLNEARELEYRTHSKHESRKEHAGVRA